MITVDAFAVTDEPPLRPFCLGAPGSFTLTRTFRWLPSVVPPADE